MFGANRQKTLPKPRNVLSSVRLVSGSSPRMEFVVRDASSKCLRRMTCFQNLMALVKDLHSISLSLPPALSNSTTIFHAWSIC